MTLSPIKLSMFILVQKDLDEAVAFYTKLGLSLNFHIKDKWAEFDLHGIKLGLVQTKAELPERRSGIVLEVDDVKAWIEMLRAEGVECVDPVERMHGVMAHFKDPGNNLIDLYQPTPEKLDQAIGKLRTRSNCCKGRGGACVCKKN